VHSLTGNPQIENPQKIQPDAIARGPPRLKQRRLGPFHVWSPKRPTRRADGDDL
jgi:hypothetical protein